MPWGLPRASVTPVSLLCSPGFYSVVTLPKKCFLWTHWNYFRDKQFDQISAFKLALHRAHWAGLTHSWPICMVREKEPFQLQNHCSWVCKLQSRTDLCSECGAKKTSQNFLYPLICEPRNNSPLTVWNSIPSWPRWNSHPLQHAKMAQQRDATT